MFETLTHMCKNLIYPIFVYIDLCKAHSIQLLSIVRPFTVLRLMLNTKFSFTEQIQLIATSDQMFTIKTYVEIPIVIQMKDSCQPVLCP